MMTVKEIAEITGISARTLHYYDEIGLLKPTAKSEAGYRLYDDKALETLQQILFFREFDIPLKEIKSIITSPDFSPKVAGVFINTGVEIISKDTFGFKENELATWMNRAESDSSKVEKGYGNFYNVFI